MIESIFIDSAREIRKKYLRLSEELDKNKEKVQKLSEYLTDKIKELDDLKDEIRDKVTTKEQFLEVSNKILLKVNEIEDREKSLTSNITKINNEMESLKREEVELLKKIQVKYPKLTTEQIRLEIHSKL